MASLALGGGGYALGSYIGSFFGPIGTLTGAAIGGAIGGALGAAAGGIIDQTLLFPAIFGKESVTLYGPKIADFQVTTASPGTPITFCIGRENRISGCIIWLSDVRPVEHDQTVGGKGGHEVISTEYFIDIAIAWCEGSVNGVRKIWADGKLIWDNGKVDQRYDDIIHYLGDQTAADPTIEGDPNIGVGNAPAFVGTCYTLIKNFAMQDWGNRIPNLTGLIEGQEQALLADAVEKIWTRAGRPNDEIDVTWLRGVEVVGYPITGPQSAQKMLEPLAMAFDMLAQEKDGIVNFRRRQDYTVYDVPKASLAAYEEGSGDPARPIKVTDTPTYDLPGTVIVKYKDPAQAWQDGAQRAKRFLPKSPNTAQVALPFVMDGNTAKAIAKRILWSAFGERQTVELTLPPSAIHLLESDLLGINADERSIVMRVTQINRGANYVIQVSGATEESATLVQTGIADIPILPIEPGPLGASTDVLVFMEIPMLAWEGYDRGMHYAVFRGAPSDTWVGGRIAISTDGGTTYAVWGESGDNSYRLESQGGITQSALPAGGIVGYWDNDASLDVEMFNGTLQSVSEATADAGANHLYVGKNDGTGEIIAFQTATLVSPSVYHLTKLLRGRYGTEDRMNGHLIGDYAVLLLSDRSIRFREYGVPTSGSTYQYKAVPQNHTAADVTAVVTATRLARSVTPWSVAQLAFSRDSTTGDFTISWLRRSVVLYTLFWSGTATPAPLNFADETYDIEIVNPSGGTVVRTYPGFLYNIIAYTNTNWIADGMLNPFRVNVYQLNRDLGINGNRGIVQTLTVSF